MSEGFVQLRAQRDRAQNRGYRSARSDTCGPDRYLTRFVTEDATLRGIVESDLVFLLVLVVLLYSQTTPTLRFSGTLY
jgi:hypothetical protein